MIAPMRKLQVAVREADRDRLVTLLGEWGVLHIAPVSPQKAKADRETVEGIERLGKAIEILEMHSAAESASACAEEPLSAAGEVVKISRGRAELVARSNGLRRELEQMNIWGDAGREQVEQLRRSGLAVVFAAVPSRRVGELQADLVHVIRKLGVGQVLVALAGRGAVPALPAGVEALELPSRSAPAIRAEVAEIEAKLQAGRERMAELAPCVGEMRSRLEELRAHGRYVTATRGGLLEGPLYAIGGWVPENRLEATLGGLAAGGLDYAARVEEPDESEQPPTLLDPPRWARPIGGLLEVLGTVPGYAEFDVSAAFMVALPVFAAMLIGDGGYGLLFLLLPALFYRKVAARIGARLTQLVMVLGVTTVAWGVMTDSYFGVSLSPAMSGLGGVMGALGRALSAMHVVTVSPEESSQRLLERITFTIGAIHLSAAHLMRARWRFPDQRFLGSVGWSIGLWGMYGLVNHLVLGTAFGLETVWPYLMMAGGALVVLFTRPRRNLAKRVVMGALNAVFPAIATLSDTVSYVRLMAIGLAGAVLAASFNGLAMSTGTMALAIPILVAGHLLNIGLCVIAIFAHGVRLNILEFSNNLGMEWTGYAYEPFVTSRTQRES